MIHFDRVTFRYSAGLDPALVDVDFRVEPGACVALLGANGSGKSTAVRLTNALLLPTSGRVTVDGLDTASHAHLRDLRRAVGIVFQRPDDQIVATSVEDDVAFGPENLGLSRSEIRERVDQALALTGLTGLETREPHLLSGGQKQRLAIAGALAMRPRYLVLDEPTSMLDPNGRAEVLSVVRSLLERGVGVLHVTHDLDAVRDADRAIVLDAGRVAFAGGIDELYAHDEGLDAWGLAMPPLSRLSGILAGRGAPVTLPAVDPERMAEALCR